MASSSGASSASTLMQNSGSETDLLDERKRKRMNSNRESARRSRMRKQKQLDDLVAQVGQLRSENNQIIGGINSATQHYLDIEAENSVLRAQHQELNYRLQYLNQIIGCLTRNSAPYEELDERCGYAFDDDIDGLLSQWHAPYLAQQPIAASAEVFHF
uniref:BZIP domain-containing protein n=1 Tax=Kalanchoe fedtschenkoi TaxID=63787 RepID=A0A7N0TE53_KALFE